MLMPSSGGNFNLHALRDKLTLIHAINGWVM